VSAPLNQALCELAERHLRQGRGPETLASHEVIEHAKVPQWTS
jgi:hypothetical protein